MSSKIKLTTSKINSTPVIAKDTVRILSLDGGGMKGYMSATFLARFCSDAGINPNQLFNSFDIITGTSIGGIQALAYSNGLSPGDMLGFFSSQGSNIFHYDSLLPLQAYKFSVIMSLPTYPTTFYAQAPLQTAISNVFGTNLLISDLKTNVIIPAWSAKNDQSVIFSNITGLEPFLSGASQDVVTAALATSAAPLYFPAVATAEDDLLIDGGVYQNNPVITAFSVAKKLYPNASRFCVLSLGCGIAHNSFVPETSLFSAADDKVNDLLQQDVDLELANVQNKLLKKYPDRIEHIKLLTAQTNSIAPYNVDYLFYLMENVFIPGVQEINDKTMAFESTDLFDDIFYYRFQYEFQPGQDSSLDNYSPDNLANLASYANTQYNTDLLEIQAFIEHFNL